MKLLLTSSGVTNDSIRNALIDLLGKPIEESSALFIATGMHPFAQGPGGIHRAIAGEASARLYGLGWKAIGLLEPTALPSIDRSTWKRDGEILKSEMIKWVGSAGEEEVDLVTAPGIGLVDFGVIPHFVNPDHGDVTPTNAETWAAHNPGPTYAIDEATALKVVDGGVEVVSEGRWQLFTPWADSVSPP